MFTFGCVPVLDLAPDLSLNTSSSIVRSQNGPDVQYEVVSGEDDYQCSCPDPIPVSISSPVSGPCTVIRVPWCLS